MTDQRPQSFRLTAVAQLTKRVLGLLPGLPTGYQDTATGEVLPATGDDKFPFVKDPTDISEAVTYRPIAALPTATNGNIATAGFETLETIDVRDARLLTLFVKFTGSVDPIAEGQVPTLGILPETALVNEGQGTTDWYFYGVVNPVLYGSGLYGTSSFESVEPQSTAFRDCFVTQLNVNYGVDDGLQPIARNVQLTFDVSDKTLVRFRVASVSRFLTAEDSPAPVENMLVGISYQLQR